MSDPTYDASEIEDQDGFIDVLHEPMSPESWDYTGRRTATRCYIVEWSKRLAIRNWLIGLEEDTDDNGIFIQRPRRYPDEDGLWVSRVDSIGLGASRRPTDLRRLEIEYDYAILTVNYEAFPLEVGDETWRVISFDSSKQFRGLAGFLWTFASGQSFPGQKAVFASKGQVDIQWPRAPSIPPLLQAANGKVNSVTFADNQRNYSWDPETLRVDRVRITETRNMSNQRNYDIGVTMIWDDFNHNKEINPYNGDPEYVYKPGGGKTYEAIDFNQILPI